MELSQQHHCLNCKQALSTAFCGACGQKKAERISLRVLLKIAQRGIIEFKSPLLVTLWGLTIHPGKVYREYLNGRRATYFNPIRYSFWLITLCVITSSFFEASLIDFSQFRSSEPSEKHAQIDALVTKWLENSFVYVFFVFAICHAAVMKLFFWKQHYKFSELYVVCLLSASHFCLIYSLVIALGLIDYAASLPTLTILAILYATWALAELYQPRHFANYLKSLLAYLFGMLISMFIFGVSAGIYFAANISDIETKKEIEPVIKEIIKPN